MRKIILDTIELALITLLLGSSYFGFFFAVAILLLLGGAELTTLTVCLVFVTSVSVTHQILRWLCNVQGRRRMPDEVH